MTSALSVKDARKLLGGISHATFYRHVQRGLNVRKLGGRTVVLKQDLEAYLNSLPDALATGAIRKVA